MAYGNTSVSALLSQARAALKKQQSLEEEVAAYEYDLSPKNQESFNKYQDFLAKRIDLVKESDPSKSLSLQRKITGAQRSFTSSEIQRQSIAIAEGNGNKQSKLNSIIGLYRQALENGDEATAQRLQLQADQLQISIQQEAASGAGRGGGGSSAAATAAKKGINDTLNKIDIAQRDFKADLRKGKLTSKEYIAKMGQTYDAKDKVLQGTYTIDAEGYVRPTGGLDNGAAEEFYKTHDKLQNDEGFQRVLGTNRNVPFELRMAQIGDAFNTKYDALTGEVKWEPRNAVGQRRLTEFGSTLATPTIDDNPNGKQYTEGFKSLGLSGGGNGSIEKTYKDYSGNTRKANFYLDNPDKPGYAYTQDENGVRYAINPDAPGGVTMLGDSVAASKQYEQLQSRLANPNISPQEAEAIQNDIRNLNTDYVPQELLDKNKQIAQKQSDDQLLGLPAYGRKFANAAGDVVDAVQSGTGAYAGAAGKVLDYAGKNKVISQINSLASGLGIANPFGSVGGAIGGSIGIGGQLKGLYDKFTGLKKQAEAKAAADAAQRAAEFQANQNAIAKARADQAAYQAQVAAQNRQNVALPYKATPQGQADSKVIGTPSFNEKYLGSYGSLLNKYLTR